MGGAIIVGLLVWAVVGAMTRFFVLQTPETGVFEGLIAGVWAAWPFFLSERAARYNFLHPVPRRYKVPLKQAFAKVRQTIGDKTYNYGDKWRVSTADTMQRRIKATLKFTDEESHLEASSLQNMHMKTERKQRLIELDVQMKEEPNDMTVVQFDFYPRVEGVAFYACDAIVSGILSDTETILGDGTAAGDPAETALPAPPWWLLGVSAYALLVYFCDVMKAVFAP
jgi:hypothetical protein